MSDTHTPGPWAVSDGREVHPGAGTDAVVIVDQEGSWIAETHTTTSNANPALDANDLPAEANARLMASAPALLRALTDLAVQVEKSNAVDDHGHRLEHLKALADARTEIAKAKGEA